MTHQPVDRQQRTLWLVLFWAGVVVTVADRPAGISILLVAGTWWLFDPNVRTRRIAENEAAPPPDPDADTGDA